MLAGLAWNVHVWSRLDACMCMVRVWCAHAARTLHVCCVCAVFMLRADCMRMAHCIPLRAEWRPIRPHFDAQRALRGQALHPSSSLAQFRAKCAPGLARRRLCHFVHDILNRSLSAERIHGGAREPPNSPFGVAKDCVPSRAGSEAESTLAWTTMEPIREQHALKAYDKRANHYQFGAAFHIPWTTRCAAGGDLDLNRTR